MWYIRNHQAGSNQQSFRTEQASLPSAFSRILVAPKNMLLILLTLSSVFSMAATISEETKQNIDKNPSPMDRQEPSQQNKDNQNNNEFRGPIEIIADSAELDEKQGLTVYRGDVTIQQGEITIAADTVTLKTQQQTNADSLSEPSRTVSKIVASGSPARFTRHTEEQTEPIRAEGETIRYNVASGIILLEKNASIDRNGSTFSGEKIEYFIEDERVKAESNPNDKGGRVHTVFTPTAASPPPNENKQNNKVPAEPEQ